LTPFNRFNDCPTPDIGGKGTRGGKHNGTECKQGSKSRAPEETTEPEEGTKGGEKRVIQSLIGGKEKT